MHTADTEASGNGCEIDRPELCSDTLAAPPPLLPHADRSVSLVVEDENDDLRALAGRGLELGHRHRHAAVTHERDDRAIAMHERRRDRRRDRVAHRTGCRTDERARSAEPEAAACPAGEVAGIGRQDPVIREHFSKRGDDPSRMDARTGPGIGAGIDGRGGLPGGPIVLVVGSPPAHLLGVEDSTADEPLIRGP